MTAVAPKDLGPRASLLADKHAHYIKGFAEVPFCPLCAVADGGPSPFHAAVLVTPEQPCSLVQQTETFEYYATEHFRLSGVYWGITGLALLGRLHDLDEDALVSWVRSCQVTHAHGGSLQPYAVDVFLPQ